ncbi:MAG: adenylyltransferase [Rickettsiales bacterium]|nr:adenylyltransferase [Rickettsiales bacterium]OUV54046.1 MAG: hypothetical protein CBC87_01835 [Rickettsiales bacterium TMED127]|tara:strand:+ start:37060 stop:37833 length:774 start_codon:yes stop_codon:yes gene_type:complete
MKNKNLDEVQVERYSRQILIDELGLEGQLALLNSSVLVIGCGGLGTAALTYLSMSGIGKIGVVDFDSISLSNLSRQILFTEKEIGKSKVQIAKKKIKTINSKTELKVFEEKISKKNIKKIFEDYKIVLDCTDNFKSRYLINDECYSENKILITAAIQGFDVQLFILKPWYKNLYPCYRCIFPEDKKIHQINNCDELGVLSPVAGLGGVLQAISTIKVIINCNEKLFSTFHVHDTLNDVYNIFNYEKDSNCKVCNHKL